MLYGMSRSLASCIPLLKGRTVIAIAHILGGLNAPMAPPFSIVPTRRTSVDDVALARRVAAGDAGAERALWDAYAPLVRRFVQRAFGPHFDVGDLVQDVFLEVFKRSRTLNKPDSLRSFVFAVAMNVVRMELRKRRVRSWVRLTDTGSLPEVQSPEDEPGTRAAARHLYQLLDQLGVSERECFVLRHFEELELTEVATATGLSLATVKRRLLGASQKLATLVAADKFLSEFTPGVRQGGSHEPG